MLSQTIENKVSSVDSIKFCAKDYTLIITEKPVAAKRIAYALDLKGKPKRFRKNNVTYYVANRDKKLLIVPSIGHLYTIVQKKGKYNYYPIFNFKWVPRYQVEKGAQAIRNWIKTFSELSFYANQFISACDFDIEGSLIAYFILKYACKNKEIFAKRMKFSTLTKSELKKAYENPLPELNFSLIESGKIRHEIDWLYGINLSRALTLAFDHWSGKYFSLTTGRVQGPTLQFLVKREKEISNFNPIPFWEIDAKVEILNFIIKADYERKRIDSPDEAKVVIDTCSNRIGEVNKLDLKIICKKPPIPFDISTLQHEAYRLFGYDPQYTLVVAQRLYLDAMISYPRTNSQKLPALIDFRNILLSLKEFSGYKRLASNLLKKEVLKPFEGTKGDPAHPAIYPTGKLPIKPLKTAEKRIWDLIIRRFMAVFGDDAVLEKQKVRLLVKNHSFFVRGSRLLKKGWIQYYKPFVHIKEVMLPSLNEGEKVKFQRMIQKEKFTCPPTRYNPSSILRKMEMERIGTKTTRANIIQTLYNRKYIKDKKIVVTELGLGVNEVLKKYVPIVTSVQLTQEIEGKMEEIQKGNLKGRKVLEDVVKQLQLPLELFKKNEDTIGEFLSKTTNLEQLEKRVLGSCPTCNSGKLVIIHSRTTKKRFIGCTNYFKGICETSFPLPQRGKIKPIKNICRTCGWPQVLVVLKSRKPWKLCFNPSCSIKNSRFRK